MNPFAVFYLTRATFDSSKGNGTEHFLRVYQTSDDLRADLNDSPIIETRAELIECYGGDEGFRDEFGDKIADDPTYAFRVCYPDRMGRSPEWFDDDNDAAGAYIDALIELYSLEWDSNAGRQTSRRLTENDPFYNRAIAEGDCDWTTWDEWIETDETAEDEACDD